jgi:hypothetical protein
MSVRDPIEFAGDPIADCDCCCKERPLQRTWAFGNLAHASIKQKTRINSF